MLQIRKQKGMEVAKNGNVKLNGYKWSVPSQSSNKTYEVMLRIDKSVCNCPDFVERGLKCKHIFAVEITLTKIINKDGTITETKTVRKTYPQDWANYTKAQVE
ncbi:SWIM zinc finger domain-containing protein [Candidatus Marsarchaeota archaeon]|nr:SWIM zinc finger domain-containing protein [Candidatus Marsarchaeota archaeon]